MRFRLTTIFYATALIGASIAAFTVAGLVVSSVVLVIWGIVWAWPSHAYSFAVVLAVFFAFSVTCVLLKPAVSAVPPPARQYGCHRQLREIGLALKAYESDYGCLPPSCVVDEQGRPMHSWRVLLLPYLEEEALYNAYDFSEPWNGPMNSALLARISTPGMYLCPSSDSDYVWGRTDYVAIVGPGSALRPFDPTKSNQIVTRSANTLAVAEIRQSDVCWAEPRDVTVDEFYQNLVDAEKLPAHSAHHLDNFLSEKSGWNGVFADGTAAYLDAAISRDSLRRLTTGDGGDRSELGAVFAVERWK